MPAVTIDMTDVAPSESADEFVARVRKGITKALRNVQFEKPVQSVVATEGTVSVRFMGSGGSSKKSVGEPEENNPLEKRLDELETRVVQIIGPAGLKGAVVRQRNLGYDSVGIDEIQPGAVGWHQLDRDLQSKLENIGGGGCCKS